MYVLSIKIITINEPKNTSLLYKSCVFKRDGILLMGKDTTKKN